MLKERNYARQLCDDRFVIESWNVEKERKEIETILYVFLRFKDSSIFFIHKRNFRRKR